MGLDAKDYAGYGYAGKMDVYNGASLLGTINFNLAGNAGESDFLGWQNAGGITRVVVSSPTYGWSPIIDDHTYGVIPEPTTPSLLALGLLALVHRRRAR